MSGNLYLEIDTGGTEPATIWDRNYTHNTNRMLRAAGFGFRDIDGMSAADAVARIEDAIRELKANPDRYREMNPENGWGSYEGILDVLCEFAQACHEHPKTTVAVSG